MVGRSFTTEHRWGELEVLRPETPMTSAVPRFLLAKQRLSDKSKTEYDRYLREFAQWAGGPRLCDLTPELVDEWVGMRKRTSVFAARAACAYLKSFASWLAEERIVHNAGVSIFAGVKTPRVPREGRMPLDDAEIDRVWQVINSQPTEYRYRDAALIWLMFSTGLRRNEARELLLEDVHLDPRGPNWIEIRWHTSKGRKTRRVTFGRLAAKALVDYIDNHRPTYQGKAAEPLFLTAAGKPFKDGGFVSWLGRLSDLFEANGIKDWKAHRMRHTWATWYHRGSRDTGKTVYDLKREGGWEDLSIPLRYTHDRPWEELASMPTPIEAIYARRRAG